MDKLGRPFLTEEEEECGWQEVAEDPDAAPRAVELEGVGIALNAVEADGPGNALSAVDPESSEAALSAVDPESPGAALSAVELALGWWFWSLGVIRGWRKGRLSLKDVRTVFVFFFLFNRSDFKKLESLRFLSEKVV